MVFNLHGATSREAGAGPRAWVAQATLLLALVLACTGSGVASDAGGSGADGDLAGGGGARGEAGSGGSSTAGAGGSAGSEECHDPPPGSLCVDAVVGRFVSPDGDTIPNLGTTVCGDVCYKGKANEQGVFQVNIGAPIDPREFSVLAHGRPEWLGYYYAIRTIVDGIVDMGDITLFPVPPSGPELVITKSTEPAPAQIVESNDVELTVPEGVRVRPDLPDALLGVSGRRFRAARMTETSYDELDVGWLGLFALFGFTPYEAAFLNEAGEAKVRLSFPNPDGLPAGTRIEILAQGSLLAPRWVALPEFQLAAEAVVTTDGARIEMLPGEGVPFLTWAGLRVAK